MPAPSRAQVLRRTAVLGAGALAAAMSVRELVRPRGDASDRRLLDWDAVRGTAHARSAEPRRMPRDLAARRGAEYDAHARELAPLMAAVCQSTPHGFPSFQVLDRHGFIDANLEIVRRLVGPVEALRAEVPDSIVTAWSRQLMSRYVGELFGFMSQRVLGQYDPVLMLPSSFGDGGEQPAPSLYLVEPNVTHFEKQQRLPGEALRRYLILHELTHAWQFESHPWLRQHLVELMGELLMTSLVEEATRSKGRLASSELVRKLPDTVRTQLRGVNRVQAIMSVLEGYSNFVMNRVGRSNLEHFDELENAMHRRQGQRSLFERLVYAITGLNMKMRQYRLGESFSEAVTATGGLDLLNRVWDGPEMMPSMQELRAPERWVERVGRP